jgi:hypothetical protein
MEERLLQELSTAQRQLVEMQLEADEVSLHGASGDESWRLLTIFAFGK